MKPIFKERIELLRGDMKKNNIAATIVPKTDPHQSEYIPEYWQIQRWLCGFTGSNGTLVVTAHKAFLWTDSRYFIQAAQQIDGTGVELMKEGLLETPSIPQYLADNLTEGDTVAYNGLLFSVNDSRNNHNILSSKGIKIDEEYAPYNELWTDRPSTPKCKVIIHEERLAGESVASKIEATLKNVASHGANSTFIAAVDEIPWLLNIRSRDVKCNPGVTSFLYLAPTGTTLFIDSDKLDENSKKHFSYNNIAIAPYDSIKDFLKNIPTNEKVLINEAFVAGILVSILGDKAVSGSSPIALLKSIKNNIQVENTRGIMVRDGVALVKLFMEIERRLKCGESVDECDVANLSTKYRAEHELFFDDSFEPIVGYNALGAIVHRIPTPETSQILKPEGMLLVDTGAQYLDGTTDITRTVSLGNATAQQKRDFTLVMKGHIALGTMIFPNDTRGAQLDALARQFLWKEGLSYLHGTGHGVGYFLNVHEGPQSIRLNENPALLMPGMITSNEPGVYREGEYGIRCENLVLTVPAFSTEFGEFYKFETLTLFPFDLNLFDTSIMSDEEIAWINDYHTMVRERLTPHLNTEQAAWLADKTRELTR